MQSTINTLLDPIVNFGKATVSGVYTNSDLVIALTTGHGDKLPSPSIDGAFNLVWYNASIYADPSDDPNVEIVRCTARLVDTLTVTRGQEGTLASNKNILTNIYKMILSSTKKTVTDIKAEYQSEVSTHSGQSTGVHGVGASTVESIAGSTSKVSTHANATGTAVHGLGTMSTQAANNVSITGGAISGLTSLGVNGNISVTGTVDGVDISAHVANVTTAHLPLQTGNTGKYLKTDGSSASWQTGTSTFLAPEQVPKVASNNVRHSYDTETVISGGYTLYKTITFTNGLTGTIRLFLDTYTGYSTQTFIQFRVNGVVIADIWRGGSYPWTTQSADATRTFLPGESIELWYLVWGTWSSIRNWRIAYDNDPNIVVPVTYS